MFKRIYNFVLLFKEYAVLSLLLVISLTLMALNDNTQIRHIRGVATVAFGAVQEQHSVTGSKELFGTARTALPC